MTEFIEIDGTRYDISTMTVPSDKIFREAWAVNGDVIGVDITKARSQAHEVRRKWRSAIEYSSFSYNNALFACDKDSVERIAGAVQMARIMEDLSPGSFSQGWLDNNDVVHTLDMLGINGLFMALGQHAADAFANSEIKKAAINSETDPDNLAAIIATMETEIEAL